MVSGLLTLTSYKNGVSYLNVGLQLWILFQTIVANSSTVVATDEEMLKSLQLEQIKSLHKWIDEHPDYKNNDKETHEYTLLINKCTCSFDEHEKAMFKNLCESTYLKDL